MDNSFTERTNQQPPLWLFLLSVVIVVSFAIVFFVNKSKDQQQAVDQQPIDYATIFKSPNYSAVTVTDYGRVPDNRFWFEVMSNQPLVPDATETFTVVEQAEAKRENPSLYAHRPWIAKTLHRKRVIAADAPALVIGQGPPPVRSELWIGSDASNKRCYVYGFYPVVTGTQ